MTATSAFAKAIFHREVEIIGTYGICMMLVLLPCRGMKGSSLPSHLNRAVWRARNRMPF